MTDMTNAQTDLSNQPEERPLSTPEFRHVARVIFTVFILTFIASRVMVILIESGKAPDFYFHVGATHVHHLNYGIFTLSGVGAYLLFRRPSGKRFTWATIFYAVGLALTFDEFGMWVKLGGSYWQRASFDAVTIIAAAFGLIAFMPSYKRFKTQHWVFAIIMSSVVACSIGALAVSVTRFAHRYAPWLEKIEAEGPQ